MKIHLQQLCELPHFLLVVNDLKDFLTGVGPCSVVLVLSTNFGYLRLPQRAVWCRPGRNGLSSPVCQDF